MKKWLKGFSVGLLVLGLAACGEGDKEEPTAGAGEAEQTEQQAKAEEEKSKPLTVEEVFDKATEASKEIESMSMDMQSAQKIEMPDMELKVENEMNGTVEMVQEPFAMHQDLEMGIGDGKMAIEMYIVEDGVYMHEPQTDQWMKLPGDNAGDLQGMMDLAKNSEVDLEDLEAYKNDFELEEKGNQYILRMKGDGDSFKEMIEDQVEDTGILEDAEEEAQALKDMVINEIDYELFINKETFHMEAYNMFMDIEMIVDENKTTLVQDLKVKVNDMNSIDEIVVPDEVKDQAIEAQ